MANETASDQLACTPVCLGREPLWIILSSKHGDRGDEDQDQVHAPSASPDIEGQAERGGHRQHAG